MLQWQIAYFQIRSWIGPPYIANMAYFLCPWSIEPMTDKYYYTSNTRINDLFGCNSVLQYCIEKALDFTVADSYLA